MASVLLGVLAAFVWSIHDLVARSFASRIGPFRMAAFTMAVGGLIVVAIVLPRGLIWQAAEEGLVLSVLMGLAYGIGMATLFKAFSYAPISLVGPITASYPALIVVWGLLHGLAPSALQWSAIASVLTGALIVARTGHADGGINAVERKNVLPLFVYCLICMVAYGAAVVLAQNATVQLGEYEVTAISRPFSVIVLIPFLLGEAKPPPLQRRHWLGIGAMALLDVIGVTAINISGLTPNREFAALGISAYGGIAVILAALVLKERVSPGQWLGILLIVAGVATISGS